MSDPDDFDPRMFALEEQRTKPFKSRGINHNRLVQTYLRQLAEAEQRTDPRSGPESARGKDHEAFGALLTAGRLVRAVAGWALDHVYGLSINEGKLLPRQPNQTKKHPNYIESREFADRHEHERVGGYEYEYGRTKLTAKQKQILLRNLFFGGSGGFPHWLRQDAFEAMDALDFGDESELFTPAKSTRRKVGRSELMAQMRALEFVYFRAEVDGSKEEAYKLISSKFKVSDSAMKGWYTRLRKELGALEVSRRIAFAENAASWVVHANKKEARGEDLSEEEVRDRDYHSEKYGRVALEKAVAEYKCVRSVKKNGRKKE